MDKSEFVFRIQFLFSGIAMLAIRVYYQHKVLHENREMMDKQTKWHLIPGALAALISICFGLAYIFFPSAIPWSYMNIPTWLRWAGTLILILGIGLLWSAHHHLGRSFHSFVMQKEGQVFVDSGPYRHIRHPIYTAYVLNYVGGGLLAANWVLTLLPSTLFLIMTALRVPEEEAVMIDHFGDRYRTYTEKTGRLFPRLRSGDDQSHRSND